MAETKKPEKPTFKTVAPAMGAKIKNPKHVARATVRIINADRALSKGR
jgi:hypothetical protein